MEIDIKEDKVLEFKALVMSKSFFKQLEEVKDGELDGVAMIGRSILDEMEWYVGKKEDVGLVRTREVSVFWHECQIADSDYAKEHGTLPPQDQIRTEAKDQVAALKRITPQIFLK